MLLFSPTIHTLPNKISGECGVTLKRWCADDRTLVGPAHEVAHAPRLLIIEGSLHNFHLNAAKTRAFWPTTSANQIAMLKRALPLTTVTEGDIELLRAPIGCPEFSPSVSSAGLSECRQLLTKLDDVPDARIQFFLHRISVSACRVPHIFKLVPRKLSYPYAQEFDRDQLQSYSRFNLVPLSPAAPQQVRLRFRDGGHGFISMALVTHASYTTSLLASARLRTHKPAALLSMRSFTADTLALLSTRLPPFFSPPLRPETNFLDASYFGALEPSSLLQRSEGVRIFLFQALHSHAARRHWEDSLGERPALAFCSYHTAVGPPKLYPGNRGTKILDCAPTLGVTSPLHSLVHNALTPSRPSCI